VLRYFRVYFNAVAFVPKGVTSLPMALQHPPPYRGVVSPDGVKGATHCRCPK